MNFLIFILLFLPLFIFSNAAVYAQTLSKNVQAPKAPVNMTLSPTFINVVTDPGKEVASQFQVTNNNAFEENLTLDVAKYEVGNGGEGLRIVPFKSGEEEKAWMTFSEWKLNLAPNQTKTVKFYIKPSAQAALGYYYAIVVHRMKEQDKASSGAAVTGAPAFSVLLEVKSPNAKRELQLVSFATDKSFYEYLPTEFQVTFKNTGNVHVVPHGDIFVDWGDKKDVAILKINDGQGNILPGATRTYTASWNDGFLARLPQMKDGQAVRDDKGALLYETKWDFAKADKFRIGQYKANLLAVYDGGSRDIPIESHVSFWVFPWKLIGLVVAVLLLALFGLKEIIMSNVKRLRKKS